MQFEDIFLKGRSRACVSQGRIGCIATHKCIDHCIALESGEFPPEKGPLTDMLLPQGIRDPRCRSECASPYDRHCRDYCRLYSATGTMHDSAGKLGLHKIPPEMLEALARVMDYGDNKYAPGNWKQGTNWSEFFGSTLRHIYKWWRGEDIDPESGCLHLAHAICNLTFLIWYDAYRKGTDDRPKTTVYADPSVH